MKLIVICSDGTWQSPESDHATHILRMARGIAAEDVHGHKQVVFYDAGVGTGSDRLSGGLTGKGLDRNILDCYRFLVHNYEEGDRLYLFGFSRGAYTVRSLAGLIANAGIVRREHAAKIASAYSLYRRRGAGSVPESRRATVFRQAYAVADMSPVHFIGVFDTVGALGIPAPFLGTLGSSRYLFHDTEPGRVIHHARHAVAIDENRQDFEPALWRTRGEVDLQQVWFAGVHSDIGGGYPDRRLGDHAACWLMQEAEHHGLSFAPHFHRGLMPDHAAPQHDEYKGLYRAMRLQVVRHVEPVVHVSVQRRWQDQQVKYSSPALHGMLQRIGHDWSRVQLVQ
ncbi:DUF2235 domain-containing protein [Marinobacterium sediminicola]|uniref:Uncharacterized alpha/beta hydrolase domain n=1 Tax=Marinobacterium sediminicola TaxID=518898 RepID=A0ABY1S115_9GAMM|nr:DUF2235 domain-containing protein [Marinobacterium sediminicola]ULG68381.1 DUF2235 domain-containing protein [Marinobacterium sediminicola]SMR74740.1 Uncharacterized alpha/beta hydrolase domain [Marinobacterium sediminicola]